MSTGQRSFLILVLSKRRSFSFQTNLIFICLSLFVTLRVASAATIFEDDFSDCTQSTASWSPNNTTSTIPKCSSGVYSVRNTNSSYLGEMYHTFPSPKPAVFAASCKIKRPSDSAVPGLLVCLNMGTTVSGYLVQMVLASNIQVVKYVNNNSTILFSQTTPMMQDFNDICISKKGDSITVFCNHLFVTSCLDAGSLAAGDIGLAIGPNSSAIFDDISVSDTFRSVPPPGAGYSDDFNDNSLSSLWLDYGTNNDKEESDGFLKLGTTRADARAYVFINTQNIKLDMDTFAAKICISHRSGNATTMFGFFICGPQDNGGNIPLANFAINGSRYFKAYRGGESIMLTPSTLIHGTGYWDTLEVIKKRNSSYKLLVNRAVIDSLPAARVDFLITGAGIFVDQGMSVWADYFHVGSDVSTAVAHHPSNNVLGYTYRIYAPSVNDYLVDPLGRVITIRTTHGTIYRPALAPGYYLAPDHKKWTVVKKR